MEIRNEESKGSRESFKFKFVDEVEIGKNKTLVVSEREDGVIFMAQKLCVVTDEKPVNVYLKNAIHLSDIKYLKNIGRLAERAYIRLEGRNKKTGKTETEKAINKATDIERGIDTDEEKGK